MDNRFYYLYSFYRDKLICRKVVEVRSFYGIYYKGSDSSSYRDTGRWDKLLLSERDDKKALTRLIKRANDIINDYPDIITGAFLKKVEKIRSYNLSNIDYRDYIEK
jgi:hypothetical protein